MDAPVSIAKAADPARAVRATPEASIVQAVRAVAAGEADALVSGGSTGAALAAGLFHIKRARGVHRPALAVLVPVPGRPFLLLDCGANVDVRPEHLTQFAHMGAAFMEAVLGVERPRVALLSNGTEATRGTEDVQAAHAALAGVAGLNFTGNVEGFAVGTGEADVIVTDGFTGQRVPQGHGGDGGHAAARRARGGHVEPAREGRRAAAQAGARRPARRHRPRGAGRRVPARPAEAGRRAARVVRRGRDRPRHRPRRARGPGRRRRAHAGAAGGGRGAAHARRSTSEAAATVPDS